jgi:hypothetical protein
MIGEKLVIITTEPDKVPRASRLPTYHGTAPTDCSVIGFRQDSLISTKVSQ